MRNVYDLVDLGALIARIRELEFPDLQLGRWLPNVTVDRTTFRYWVNDRSQRPAAKFMSFDSETPIGGRKGGTIREGSLPKFGEKIPFTESDALLAGALDDLNPAVAADLFGDAIAVTRSALQRLELAKGEALSTGHLNVNENGFIVDLDYGIPGDHIVAPGTLWTNLAAATPLTNLVTWHDKYIADTGGPAGAIVISTRIARLIQQNTNEVVPAISTQRNRIVLDEVRSLLESESLPPLFIYDAKYKNAAGVLQRAIADDKVVFLPEDGGAGFGETQLGRTVESQVLAGRDEVDLTEAGGLPGLVVVTMAEDDPPTVWTKSAGIGIPVIEDPVRVLVADVA
jgi:hypothetical protein